MEQYIALTLLATKGVEQTKHSLSWLVSCFLKRLSLAFLQLSEHVRGNLPELGFSSPASHSEHSRMLFSIQD
jgi:hypothetical protein